jgi:hydroxymethylpyrimidine pyrophosphatase-like HAD family hydrolase
MNSPIKLISTDFDGTIFSEFENPPIPERLLKIIAEQQARGVKWVINTGRDMPGLMEALGRARVTIKPDYLVLVEREIYAHQDSQYAGWEDWNLACYQDHDAVFRQVRIDLPRIVSWVSSRFNATIYEDAYSPFCLLAGNNGDADQIHEYMQEYCGEVPGLTVVRNDVYARFSHVKYNKGTALTEIGRRLGISAEHIFAMGDHLNDLPMLLKAHAGYIAAPENAVEAVKDAIRQQGGYLSKLARGQGVADALEHFLDHASVPKMT